MTSTKQVVNMPETVLIGRHTVNIRWTKKALFELQAFTGVEENGEFRQLCIFIWCMAEAEEGRKGNPWPTPADVANDIDMDQMGKLAEKVATVIQTGNAQMGLGGDPDPLSSGPSPETASD